MGKLCKYLITNLSGKYVIRSQIDPYPLRIWNQIPEGYIKPDSGTDNWVLLTTGASEYTKKMNIYDFSGNEWKWTLERTSYSGNPCAIRGGAAMTIFRPLPITQMVIPSINMATSLFDQHFINNNMSTKKLV